MIYQVSNNQLTDFLGFLSDFKWGWVFSKSNSSRTQPVQSTFSKLRMSSIEDSNRDVTIEILPVSFKPFSYCAIRPNCR